MKKHHEKKIDDLLRSSLGDLHAETSLKDWQNIRKSLDEDQKKPGFPFSWPLLLSLIILFMISGIFSYFFFRKHEINPKTANEVQHFKTRSSENQNFKENLNRPDEINNHSKDITSNQNANLEKVKTNSSPKNKKPFLIRSLAKKDILKNRNYSNSGGYDHSDNEINSESDFTVSPYIDPHLNPLLLPGSMIENKVQFLKEPGLLHLKGIRRPLPVGSLLKHFYISALMSPEFDRMNISVKPGSQDYVHQDYMVAHQVTLPSGIGFSAGLTLNYKATQRFSIGIGIKYISFMQPSIYDYRIMTIPVIDSASGKIIGYINNPDNNHIAYHNGVNTFNYLSVPLNFCYGGNFSPKLGWKIGGGADLLIFMGATGKWIRPDNLQLVDINTVTNLRKINYGLTLSAGFSYAINNKLKLELIPSFHKVMNSVFDNSVRINDNIYSIELQTGIKYRIF